ncbi:MULTISPECIES: EpsG family protein [Lactococcus]|uniref:EpsG family protein n=1 Tax=Lactococcus TaxID=1357 RepID=UPI0022E32428|nr:MULTISPECIES: EpsG family protein [Lactococcus]MDT2895504.1 EpsG family protein [Lactococcus lactis]
MIVYITLLILTSFFSYFLEVTLKFKKSFFKILAFIFVLLPGSILAGIRDFTVGTDVFSYVVPNFNFALLLTKFSDYNSYISNLIGYGYTNIGIIRPTEFGYNLLTFLFSRITTTPRWLMFTLQFATLYFILKSIVFVFKRFKISITLQMFIYMSIFYLQSLNIMRQALAVAIILYAILCFSEKKYTNYLFYQILAFLFHSTALIGIVFVIGYHLIFVGQRNLYLKKWFKWLIIPVLFLIFGQQIFDFTFHLASLIPGIGNHLASFDNVGGILFRRMIWYLLPGILFILLCLLNLNFNRNAIISNTLKDKWLNYIALISIITLSIFSLYSFQTVIPRFGVYGEVWLIFGIPLIIQRIDSPMQKLYTKNIVILMCIVLFFYYMYSGNGDVYPYTSEILKNLF